MQQSSKGNSEKIRNKTTEALKILDRTNNQVNSVLEDINAKGAGYKEIDEMFSRIQDDIDDARDRSVRETIRIGILGGTGSGKSTLANALMGDNLLPDSALVFCTSIPTTIRYSKQHFLEVRSELEKHSYLERNVEPERMKEILHSICRERTNPNNNKKISRITIGVPAGILHGKEIVDVPGFTRGNPLHQAFAERYTKYYCDVCLVLINNVGSVEINSRGGLEALTCTFKNRLDSTAFIINKCDEGSRGDIDSIEQSLREYLKGERLDLFRISSRNSLDRTTGQQYEFRNLLEYLALLSSRKALVIVKALLERLVTNFTSLRDLCHLSHGDLETLHKDIKNLLNIEFDDLSTQFKDDLSNDEILPNEVPKIEVSAFDLPGPVGKEPYEYAKRLVDNLCLQAKQIDEYVQQYQAQLYRAFNSRFEDKLGEFNQILQGKVNEFEDKFGISSSIQMPKVENVFRVPNFNPSQIERLKPPVFRLWSENMLPEILARDVKFWLSPISIKAGPLSIKLGIPVGVKRKSEMAFEMQKNIPEEAIKIMNEYIYNSLNNFVNELDKAYESVITQFINDWRKCLREYLKQIEIAKVVTEPASLKRVDDFVKSIRHSSEQIADLMSQD